MLREVKEIVTDYGILGLVFGSLSIIIRPAKPWLDSVKDVVAAITLAIIVGLVLKDSGLSDTTIYGVIGGCSCFAGIIFTLLSILKEYNMLTKRKLPQFNRQGGDDRA